MARRPLLIAIRCHDFPEFVLDEVDSVFHYSETSPHVILAIDRAPHNSPQNQEAIRALVTKHYPQVGVFASEQQWGWGAGMYGLLCDSLMWAEQNYEFENFLSLDYDALFIGRGADSCLVADARKPGVGLVGTTTTMGESWKQLFDKRWSDVIAITGGKQPRQPFWEKQCVYGAVMCLSRPAIDAMKTLGWFQGRCRNIKDSVRISDDPWLTFLVLSAGFTVCDNKTYCYNVWRTPEDYRMVLHNKPDLKIWHPAKMGPGGRPANKDVERCCRNFFRLRREKKALQK